jgi:3-phosphoshikimate 1-carboxyvinyltransferase
MPDPTDQPPGSDPASHLRRPLDSLPDPLPVPALSPPPGAGAPFAITLRPPGSKSLTNRALLLAALADGASILYHPLLEANDTERMIEALTLLGAKIARRERDGSLHIEGVSGTWHPATDPSGGATLNLNNAGTATRFLAAAALLSPVPITIDGNPRMRKRPIGQLVEALRLLGARCEFLGDIGCPPLRISCPSPVEPGLRIEMTPTASSQFISALLLIAPFLRGGLTLSMRGPITSRSYIELTLGLLDALGATVKMSEDLRIIRVAPPNCGEPGLPAFEYDVEPDASSATYFWAAAALFPEATCRIDGLGPASLQPDAAFPELLARMGAPMSMAADEHSITIGGPTALEPITADLSLMPDAAMTLAAVACFASGPSTIRGLETLRHKESDRIEALRNELTKIGVGIDTPPRNEDALIITPPPGGIDTSPAAPRVEFDTYDDHRMAMSLALIALRRPNTHIKDPTCVRKTYPTFWQDLAHLYSNSN